MQKAYKLKIARTLKMNLASMGYRVDLRPFHMQQTWLLLERMLTLVLQFVYFVQVANTAAQYISMYFGLSVGTLMYTSLVSTIIEMANIFLFIDSLEQVINGSECPTFRLIHTLSKHINHIKNSRIRIPKVQSNVQKRQPTCGKMLQSYRLSPHLCDHSRDNITQAHC